MNHYEPARLVSLGIAFTVLLVLIFGSVLLSLGVINVALAVDMPDAPVTQDTATAGNDGNDDNDRGGDDQEEDAPVTQDTINVEEESRDSNDEDNSEQNNNDDNDDEPATEIKDAPNCPEGQETGLFTTCIKMPIQACPSSQPLVPLINPSFGNNCLNR